MLKNKSWNLMRLARVACAFLIAAGTAAAQTETWHLDSNHSSAEFSVRHMGISTVRGAFSKVGGDVTYDPSNVSQSTIDVVIDATSVDTHVEMRDKDLRGDHFLNVAQYPTLTFKSKRVTPAGTGKLQVTGDLTLHGVTKEVTLEVDGPTAPMKDPRGNLHMGASATTKIDRTDFGMTGMTAMVGSEVSIQIDVELVQRLGPPRGSGQAPPAAPAPPPSTPQ